MGSGLSAELEPGVFRVGDDQLVSTAEESQLVSHLSKLTEPKKFKYEKYFLKDPLFELFFVKSGTQFKYCLGIARWRQMPYFSLIDFRSLEQDMGFLKRDRDLLNQLFRGALDFMHNEQRFTYFYATRVRPLPSRQLRTSGMIAPVRGIPVFDRYDFTIEAEVPVGAAPKYPYQQSIVRQAERQFDYWIKRGTLKMKYLVPYIDSGGLRM